MIYIEQEQKNIFFTSPEWEMVMNLALDTDQPIGNLLIGLVRAELVRKSKNTETPLPHASSR